MEIKKREILCSEEYKEIMTHLYCLHAPNGEFSSLKSHCEEIFFFWESIFAEDKSDSFIFNRFSIIIKNQASRSFKRQIFFIFASSNLSLKEIFLWFGIE